MRRASRLRIDSLPGPLGHGRIGMCACPGGRRAYAAGRDANADLDADLVVLVAWGATTLVSLMEEHEFHQLGVPRLPHRARNLGLRWRHLPIRDMCAPDEEFELVWEDVGEELRRSIRSGDRIVLHCWAGLGRTGTIAARLLVELGTDPARAIREVREARPGAIQSYAQEIYVKRLRPMEPRP